MISDKQIKEHIDKFHEAQIIYDNECRKINKAEDHYFSTEVYKKYREFAKKVVRGEPRLLLRIHHDKIRGLRIFGSDLEQLQAQKLETKLEKIHTYFLEHVKNSEAYKIYEMALNEKDEASNVHHKASLLYIRRVVMREGEDDEGRQERYEKEWSLYCKEKNEEEQR